MRIAPHDALKFWDRLPPNQRARTLALDRFVDFPLKPSAGGRYAQDDENSEYRQKTVSAAQAGEILRDGTSHWLSFLRQNLRLPSGQMLFGQLQSRLMVNMSGGVLENGGLCLDRRTGMPYIPGSAVKGAARRMAIQELYDTRTAGKSRADLARLVVSIASVFGWGTTDWEQGRKKGKNGSRGEFKSDFEYACGPEWELVREPAATNLLQSLGLTPAPGEEPWQRLPNYAGMVGFLPAYPVDCSAMKLDPRPPQLGKLEADVLTCHHPRYYAGDPKYKVALDDEPPRPVVFPTVAAGHVFLFPFTVRPGIQPSDAALVRHWLADGLAAFGIGAKTSAGYGWFDCSPALQNSVLEHLRLREEAIKKQREQETAEEQARKAEEARRQAKAQEAQTTAHMSEPEKAVYLLRQLTEDKFLSKLDRWKELPELERSAIYTLFRGEKSAFWLDIAKKAQAGKQKERARWGTITQDLYRMAKERKEKMPS